MRSAGRCSKKIFPRRPATDTVVVQPEDAKSAHHPEGHAAAVLPENYQGLKRALDWVRAAESFKPFADGLDASNNWITSPSINGGVGYLANDPHLSLTFPSVFMLGFLDTKELGGGTIRTWGSVFPGTPLTVIGANDNLAWGETVAGYDVLDVYEEDLVLEDEEPVAVNFDGGEVDLIKVTLTFEVADADKATETADVYVVPHHGPIIPDSIDGTTALSYRWTGHEPTQEIRAFVGLAQTSTVDDAFEAIEYFDVGAQNFVLQDTAGDIGYYPHAKVPLRDWDLSTYKPWFVLPGDGTAEWNGYIPNEDLPKVKNPERGYLVTANNDINGTLQSGDPTDGEYYWYFDRAVGYRAQRADEMLTELAEAKGFTLDDHKAVQTDVRSNYARDLVDATLDVLGGDLSNLSADAETLIGYWDGWSFDLSTGLAGSDPGGDASADATERAGAVAAMFFAAYETELRRGIFGDELDDAGLDFDADENDQSVVAALGFMTDAVEDAIFDDTGTGGTETRKDVVEAALSAAAAAVIDDLPAMEGYPPEEWYWGRVHHLVLEHLAFAAFDLHFLDQGPFAIPGGMYTVNVAGYPRNNVSFDTTSGPSLRIIHEFSGGGIQTHLTIPGGMRPEVGDPHQLDLLDLWLAHDYYNIPNTVDTVLDAAEYMYAFVPAS
ncbi:MAG: penicillin acylase family protein [Deltaproteobacteria bacterium]|nr:penicillin acylase family protein [Deltaproteobacteria bacterium]